MLHSRNESSGSFRGGQIEVLASGGSGRRSASLQRRADAEREREAKARRRDPAFHNRVLFAGADR